MSCNNIYVVDNKHARVLKKKYTLFIFLCYECMNFILKNLNQFLEIGLLSFIPSPFSCIGLTLGMPLFPFPPDYQQQYNSVVQTFSLFKPSSNPIPSRQKEACLMFFSYLISMSRISVLRLSRRSELSFRVFLFFRRGPVDQSPN